MSNKFKILNVFFLLIAIITGLYSYKLDTLSKQTTKIQANSKVLEVVENSTTKIYVPNLKKGALETKEISVSATLETDTSKLKNITNQVLENLKQASIIKGNSYNYEVYTKNENIYLDLDSDIFNSVKSPQQELLVLYSFVNSLLEVTNYNKVIILIDNIQKERSKFIKLNDYYIKNNNI